MTALASTTQLKRAEKVVSCFRATGKAPTSKSPAYASLSALRRDAGTLPDSIVTMLDSAGEWRAYQNSEQQFTDLVDGLVAWREKYPSRWPMYKSTFTNEGQMAAWLRRLRAAPDSVRTATLDERVPGWRHSGERAEPTRISPMWWKADVA